MNFVEAQIWTIRRVKFDPNEPNRLRNIVTREVLLESLNRYLKHEFKLKLYWDTPSFYAVGREIYNSTDIEWLWSWLENSEVDGNAENIAALKHYMNWED